MTDFASCESPSGFTLPEIDIVLQHNAAVSKGDVFVVPADHINTVGNVVSGGLLISAAVKKAGMVAVALDNYAANKPGYYRVQGICRASVKSLAGAPIVRGMGLVLGTLSDFDIDGPASINAGRWSAKAIGEVAVTASATPSLQLVEVAGPCGLGNFASGT